MDLQFGSLFISSVNDAVHMIELITVEGIEICVCEWKKVGLLVDIELIPCMILQKCEGGH